MKEQVRMAPISQPLHSKAHVVKIMQLYLRWSNISTVSASGCQHGEEVSHNHYAFCGGCV